MERFILHPEIAKDTVIIPPDSLARRENWPEWARRTEASPGSGLYRVNFLQRVVEREDLGDFYFLGMPDLSEELTQRVSQYTNATPGRYGEYVSESTPPKITLVKSPLCGALRALVNRINFDIAPAIRDLCWSGWIPFKGSLQPITTSEMVGYVLADQRPKFVAVCDLNKLDSSFIEADPERPLEVNIRHSDPNFVMRPEFIVPVGTIYLPISTLIVNCARTKAAELYPRLRKHMDQTGEIPSSFTFKDGSCVDIATLGKFLLNWRLHEEPVEWTEW